MRYHLENFRKKLISAGSCVNTDGSYYCKCNPGFLPREFDLSNDVEYTIETTIGSEIDCVDIDECQIPKACFQIDALNSSFDWPK